jgi:tRNA 2-thiouridine synthesizing protein A
MPGFLRNAAVEEREKKMKTERILDARGCSCPWCCLKAMSLLKLLKPGQILEVLGTDPLTLKDLPHILEQSGDQLIGIDKQPDFFRMFLRRGRDAENAWLCR